ncbi:hypothetical protein FQN57_006180 [Myotisia sp. PD_48]|nr:hypothetical protein FQN57_006180 [Myotisia sp. PD_48]
MAVCPPEDDVVEVNSHLEAQVGLETHGAQHHRKGSNSILNILINNHNILINNLNINISNLRPNIRGQKGITANSKALNYSNPPTPTTTPIPIRTNRKGRPNPQP